MRELKFADLRVVLAVEVVGGEGEPVRPAVALRKFGGLGVGSSNREATESAKTEADLSHR